LVQRQSTTGLNEDIIVRALAAVLALLLAACSQAPRVRVGSKNFSEQLILGEIVAQHLETRLHGHVSRKLDLGGTLAAAAGRKAGGVLASGRLFHGGAWGRKGPWRAAGRWRAASSPAVVRQLVESLHLLVPVQIPRQTTQATLRDTGRFPAWQPSNRIRSLDRWGRYR
jgi:hypothetical protein